MKEIKAYICEHCGKLFRTPSRHKCKFDPIFKNCHSCKSCKGFTNEEVDNPWGHGCITELFPICEKECADSSALDISKNGYALNCSEHEYCGGRWIDYQNNLDENKVFECQEL